MFSSETAGRWNPFSRNKVIHYTYSVLTHAPVGVLLFTRPNALRKQFLLLLNLIANTLPPKRLPLSRFAPCLYALESPTRVIWPSVRGREEHILYYTLYSVCRVVALLDRTLEQRLSSFYDGFDGDDGDAIIYFRIFSPLSVRFATVEINAREMKQNARTPIRTERSRAKRNTNRTAGGNRSFRRTLCRYNNH